MTKLEKFWCMDHLEETVEYCGIHFPGEKAACLEQADRILDNTFVFREHWEMERTHEPVVFEEGIKWDAIPFGDPEWLYALNRHTCFLILGKAWRYTCGEGEGPGWDKALQYGAKYVSLLEDWLEKAPLTPESRNGTWRSLEAGIRVEFWLKSMAFFENCPLFTEEVREKAEASLRLHAKYLLEVDLPFHRLSNWGILQNHGLLLLGLYFGEKRWTQEAVKRLDEESHLQVFRDGTQWEQSPMYHGEVLYCLLDSLLHMKRFAISVPCRLWEKVHKMVYCLAAWCKPDGHMPCHGDSDDIDARDLIAQGAVLFQDARLKYLAQGVLLEDNLWNFSWEEKTFYDGLAPRKPERASAALTDSGNYFLKNGFDRTSDYLRFHCGCMGSGHGHGDQLHVDYYSHGEDILVDAGRYTYVDNEIRRRLKAPSSHNTVCIDGENFCTCVDSWGCSRMALPWKGEHNFLPGMGMVSGAHLGYLDKGVLPVRKAVLLAKGLVLLCDTFYVCGPQDEGGCLNGRFTGDAENRGNAGVHRYQSRFHFAKQGKAELKDGTVWYRSPGVCAKLLCLKGECSVTQAEISTEYNRLEECSCVENTWEASGFSSQFTVVAAAGAGEYLELSARLLPVSMVRSGRTLSSREAEAVRIVRNGSEYVVITCHQELISEVDIFTAGGYESYGKLMVFTPESREGEVLQY